MKPGFLNKLASNRLIGKTGWLGRVMGRATELLLFRTPDEQQLLRRITRMERDIVLPLKVAGIGMLLYSFYLRPWIGKVLGALEIAVEATQYFLWFYLVATVVSAGLLLIIRRLPLGLVQWIVFATCLLDGLFLAALTLVTGGYDSFLYWLFLGLIVRSAVSVPRATSQLMLNLTLSACYVLAGIIDIRLAEYLDESSRTAPALSSVDNPTEPLLLRLILLLLMTVCSYGVQVLLESSAKRRKKRGSLRCAKANCAPPGEWRPSSRIRSRIRWRSSTTRPSRSNAPSRTAGPEPDEQIRIIQEEVERSDRIITQIMGYAQLSEGRVEKLDVIEELDSAIERVFPPAAGYPVRIHRELRDRLSAVAHAAPASVRDVHQPAAERPRSAGRAARAISTSRPGAGRICPSRSRIRDDGPGIPPERQRADLRGLLHHKEKGTGLGLATVKHNVELYGGIGAGGI